MCEFILFCIIIFCIFTVIELLLGICTTLWILFNILCCPIISILLIIICWKLACIKDPRI